MIPYPLRSAFLDTDHPVAEVLRDYGVQDRQALFVLHYLTDAQHNGSAAARLAGYSDSGAAVQAGRMLRNANLQSAMHRVALMLGYTGQFLSALLAEIALRATTQQSMVLKAGTLYEGRVLKQDKFVTVTQPDYGLRMKALEKLRLLGAGRESHETDAPTIVVEYAPPGTVVEWDEEAGYYPPLERDAGSGETQDE